MLRNHFLIALRNLRKRKGYATLNIFGLALGIASCLLILQYVSYEWSYDDFHEKGSNIYRLRLDSWQEGRLSWKSATVFPAFAPTMKKDFPEVLNACRIHDAEAVISNPETNVKFAERKGYFADPPFLEMFSIDILAGNPETALEGPDKIMVSESMAKRYFGTTDVLGKQLVVKDPDMFQTYLVSGVFKDYPANSHLVIDYLVSYPTLQKLITVTWPDTTNATETSWGWYDFYTYLEMAPGTDMKAFEAKLPAFADKYINVRYQERKVNARNEVHLIPMQDVHLYSNVNQEAEVNGDGRAVSVLFLVAFFILAIAWINYINLSTARSVERGREVGVRKVMGALRQQLVGQFLVESFLLNVVALILALAAASMLMPVFSNFVGKTIPFDFWTNPAFLFGTLAALMLGTLLSGLYPAFVLSGFRPVSVLKGMMAKEVGGSGGETLRKGLIVFQFAASIALIIGTMVVYRQIQFMRNQDLGVDIRQTLVVEGPNTPLDSLYMGMYEPFKNEILKLPQVKSISASSTVPGDEIYWTNGTVLIGGETQVTNTLYNIGMDESFMDAYGLKLIAGRKFNKESGDDAAHRTTLLNESAVKVFGFNSPEDALQRRLAMWRDTLTVVGVVSDFHHQGLQKAVNPVSFRFHPDSRSYYSIKVEGDARDLLASVQTTWGKFFPDDPFHHFYLDEFFNKQYGSDIRFGQVFGLFAGLAILVACLGLLGLASYQILQRTKEIGIRKVLGASTTGIVGLLSKDFLSLVILSLAIAAPVAWYLMGQWLEGFAYKTGLDWWVFVLAGVVAVAVAFLTVSFQSVKAAHADPVKSLRSE